MTPSEARRLLLAPGAPTRSFCFYETDDRGALFTLAERRGEDIKHYPLAADVDDRGATGSIALIERTVGEPRHQALRLDAHNLREVAALEVADEGLTPWRQPRDIPSPSSHDDAALLMSFAQSAAAAASPSAAPTAVTTARTRNDEEAIEALAARMLGAPVRPGQVAVSRAEARDIATTIVTALEPAQRHAAQTRGVAVIDERDGRRLPYAVEFHPDGSVTWSRR